MEGGLSPLTFQVYILFHSYALITQLSQSKEASNLLSEAVKNSKFEHISGTLDCYLLLSLKLESHHFCRVFFTCTALLLTPSKPPEPTGGDQGSHQISSTDTVHKTWTPTNYKKAELFNVPKAKKLLSLGDLVACIFWEHSCMHINRPGECDFLFLISTHQ